VRPKQFPQSLSSLKVISIKVMQFTIVELFLVIGGVLVADAFIREKRQFVNSEAPNAFGPNRGRFLLSDGSNEESYTREDRSNVNSEAPNDEAVAHGMERGELSPNAFGPNRGRFLLSDGSNEESYTREDRSNVNSEGTLEDRNVPRTRLERRFTMSGMPPRGN